MCGEGGGVGADQLVVAVMDSGKLEHSLSKTAEGRKPQPWQAAASSYGPLVEHYITRRRGSADCDPTFLPDGLRHQTKV